MKRLMLIFSLFLIIFFMASCTQTQALAGVLNKISLPKEVTTENLDLIVQDEITGITFTWSSNNPTIIDHDGTVYPQDQDSEVILTATAILNDKSEKREFTITVKKSNIQVFTNAWDYFRPRIDSTVNRDYTKFKNDTYNGVSIRYESTNQNIITNDGKITRLLVDQVVTINCYLSYEGVTKLYTKQMTIAKLSDSMVVGLVDEWIPSQVEAFEKGLIAALPTRHPDYGTYIRWTSTNPQVLIVDGYVLKTTISSFTIYCEILLGTYVKQYYFDMNNFEGGTAENIILDNWLPTLIPSVILGSKNFIKPDLHLDSQVRTQVGGVLNQLTGQMPDITEDLIGTKVEDYIGRVSSGTRNFLTQEKLDSLFYEGYIKPNNLDIIWIVVHESGMPQVGNTALKLHEIMKGKMISNPSQSSWHYSVDEKDIFHHIPNQLSAWHASDGGTVGGGNRNGIGIEMCINQDGNYEGALHNNAKLIAYLLHEYNLTLTNIRRHYDFAPDKKQCPSYMIQTNRWHEFLDMVNREYIAMALLKNATITWQHTHQQLFNQGVNQLFFNKAVTAPTNVEVTLDVNKGSYHFNQTKTLVLGGTND